MLLRAYLKRKKKSGPSYIVWIGFPYLRRLTIRNITRVITAKDVPG